MKRTESIFQHGEPDSATLIEPEVNRWERFCGWERANREASTSRERKTDLRREFEGRAWRTPGEQIMARSARSSTASGKSHRSMTEEQEGGKEQSTNYELPPRIPLRRFLWLRFFFSESCFPSRRSNQIVCVIPFQNPLIYDSKFSK